MPINKHSATQIWVFILLGGMIGLFISRILDLPYKWMTVILMALCLPFIGFAVGDLRRFFMLLLILAIPLTIDINFVHKYEFQAGAATAGIALRDVFVVLVLVIWIIETITTEGMKVRFFATVTVPALIYIEACLVSFIWAPRPDLATLEIIRMAKVFILYFILVNNLRDDKDIRFVTWLILATVALEGAIAITQVVTGKSLGLDFVGEKQVRMGRGMRYSRVGGTLGHANDLAMYLELLLPLCVGVFIASKRNLERFGAACVFGLGLITFIMTGSRGAWIGFVISMGLFLYILLRKKIVQLRTLMPPLFIVIVIICVVVISFWTSLENRITGDDRNSAIGRIPMFQIAWEIIKTHPITGVGLNNYAVVMDDYDHTILGRRFKKMNRPVHNMYLLITAETGIIGFMTFSWFMIAILGACRKSVRLSDYRLSLLGIGILCGLVAFFVHGFVEKHPPGGYPLFYTLTALIVGIVNVGEQSEAETIELESKQEAVTPAVAGIY